ncbi:hypothetical protein LguiB_032626 [Lonicera macranthoides]
MFLIKNRVAYNCSHKNERLGSFSIFQLPRFSLQRSQKILKVKALSYTNVQTRSLRHNLSLKRFLSLSL